MVGSWLDRRHDLDLYDLLPNLNKFDECDPDLMLNTPCSEYYSGRSFNKMLVNSDAKLALFQFFTVILEVYLKT